jgi:hypothetical protein
MDYVDAQAGDYAAIMEQQGPSGIALARDDSAKFDEQYLRSRAEITAQYNQTVAMLKHNYWGHFIGEGGVEEDIARTDEEFAETIGFLNKLALLRAMTIAAVNLKENPSGLMPGSVPEPG